MPTEKNNALPPPAVLLENIRFRYKKDQSDILCIDSFSMQRSERVFISGSSGSGKSTLLALIAGIMRPSEGRVTVNGTRLDTLPRAERDSFRGDHIGFIFQQFNLIPYLTILENVLIPCRFSTVRAMRATHDGHRPNAEAKELLTRLDLDSSLWNRPVTNLSVGQQQRVAAARALMGQPEIIIADEPTSALDADRREAFLRLLLDECALLGTSLLFVSHDSALASAFPRVVSMHELNHTERREG